MTSDATLRDALAAALADPESGWSLGAFGAAAEFRRRADEPVEPLGDGRLGLRSARGSLALVLPDALRPVAYEMPVGHGWSHAVALCLPAAALAPEPATGLAEIGADAGALDPEGREAVLFALGLGLAQVSVGVRAREAGLLTRLRSQLGTRPDVAGTILPAVADGRADLVFSGPLGRIEVLGGGLGDPFGPRAYVVPEILRLGRTHVATAPIPPGLVPCAHLHPPHPCRDAAGRAMAFDPARHAAFQALLARWGDPESLALKRAISGGGPVPSHVPDRWSRAVARVARRQRDRIGGDR